MAANVPVGDSERTRFVDRIRVITFREIRDLGVDWISRSWVADHVKRSVSFVKRNWNGNVRYSHGYRANRYRRKSPFGSIPGSHRGTRDETEAKRSESR